MEMVGIELKYNKSKRCIITLHLPSVVVNECSQTARSTPGSSTCTVTWNFSVFRKRLFPCQKVLSVGERICKIVPGEERLFHPVLKPSQRDKFCCFRFVCEVFFPHSSIHGWKQCGQCWPAKNSAIHAPIPCTVPALVSLGCPALLAAGKKVGLMWLDGAGRIRGRTLAARCPDNLSFSRKRCWHKPVL